MTDSREYERSGGDCGQLDKDNVCLGWVCMSFPACGCVSYGLEIPGRYLRLDPLGDVFLSPGVTYTIGTCLYCMYEVVCWSSLLFLHTSIIHSGVHFPWTFQLHSYCSTSFTRLFPSKCSSGSIRTLFQLSFDSFSGSRVCALWSVIVFYRILYYSRHGFVSMNL